MSKIQDPEGESLLLSLPISLLQSLLDERSESSQAALSKYLNICGQNIMRYEHQQARDTRFLFHSMTLEHSNGIVKVLDQIFAANSSSSSEMDSSEIISYFQPFQKLLLGITAYAMKETHKETHKSKSPVIITALTRSLSIALVILLQTKRYGSDIIFHDSMQKEIQTIFLYYLSCSLMLRVNTISSVCTTKQTTIYYWIIQEDI